MNEPAFDWEYLGRCEYPITAPICIMEQEIDCGEYAIARVWWSDDESDAMLVCARHLEKIQQEEVKLATGPFAT